jgi:hypothetical protein
VAHDSHLDGPLSRRPHSNVEFTSTPLDACLDATGKTQAIGERPLDARLDAPAGELGRPRGENIGRKRAAQATPSSQPISSELVRRDFLPILPKREVSLIGQAGLSGRYGYALDFSILYSMASVPIMSAGRPLDICRTSAGHLPDVRWTSAGQTAVWGVLSPRGLSCQTN